jgi:hypothetical protein
MMLQLGLALSKERAVSIDVWVLYLGDYSLYCYNANYEISSEIDSRNCDGTC